VLDVSPVSDDSERGTGFGQQLSSADGLYQPVSNHENGAIDKSRYSRIIDAFKKIAFLLYARYIREYSELEVNICFRERMRLNTLMQDESKWLNETEISADELVRLFDRVCMEVYQLMNHTFYRFRETYQPAPAT